MSAGVSTSHSTTSPLPSATAEPTLASSQTVETPVDLSAESLPIDQTTISETEFLRWQELLFFDRPSNVTGVQRIRNDLFPKGAEERSEAIEFIRSTRAALQEVGVHDDPLRKYLSDALSVDVTDSTREQRGQRIGTPGWVRNYEDEDRCIRDLILPKDTEAVLRRFALVAADAVLESVAMKKALNQLSTTTAPGIPSQCDRPARVVAGILTNIIRLFDHLVVESVVISLIQINTKLRGEVKVSGLTAAAISVLNSSFANFFFSHLTLHDVFLHNSGAYLSRIEKALNAPYGIPTGLYASTRWKHEAQFVLDAISDVQVSRERLNGALHAHRSRRKLLELLRNYPLPEYAPLPDLVQLRGNIEVRQTFHCGESSLSAILQLGSNAEDECLWLGDGTAIGEEGKHQLIKLRSFNDGFRATDSGQHTSLSDRDFPEVFETSIEACVRNYRNCLQHSLLKPWSTFPTLFSQTEYLQSLGVECLANGVSFTCSAHDREYVLQLIHADLGQTPANITERSLPKWRDEEGAVEITVVSAKSQTSDEESELSLAPANAPHQSSTDEELRRQVSKAAKNIPHFSDLFRILARHFDVSLVTHRGKGGHIWLKRGGYGSPVGCSERRHESRLTHDVTFSALEQLRIDFEEFLRHVPSER